MSVEFDKCDYCGTRHQIETVYWGGVGIKTCPYIPSSLTFVGVPAIPRDPDEDNPLSTTH